jgi:hypothetical protein
MLKKLFFSLSILSLATSIATTAYFICCKKKTENKTDPRGNIKA